MIKENQTNQGFQAEDYPVVLFDSYCLICEGFVRFLLRIDHEGILKFASLDSDASKNEIKKRSIPVPQQGSVILLLGDAYFLESDAVLQIMKITKAYPLLRRVVEILPTFLRDICYRFVARNRYRVFRKKDHCVLPDPELRSRFI